MQRESHHKIKTEITCTHKYVSMNPVHLAMESHLWSHSEVETNECDTEGDQKKGW